MRRPGGLSSSGSTPQDIWVGGDRAPTARPRSGRSTYSVRTPAAIGEAPTLCGPKCGIDTRLGSSSCGDGPNEPKTHTKISPTTSSGPERTAHAPDMGRSCAGNALSACWTTYSGVPVDACASEAAPLLKAPTQVPWRRSACATPTFRENGRCLPPPPQNPMARGRPVRAPSAVGESGWASRVARAFPICTRGAGRRLPGWSLPTTPSPKRHGPRSTGARAERRR